MSSAVPVRFGRTAEAIVTWRGEAAVATAMSASTNPSETLAVLAGHRDASTRWAVAADPRTSTSTLVGTAGAHRSSAGLRGDDVLAVRIAVAARSDLPSWAMVALAQDRDLFVRAMVVQNPATATPVVDAIIERLVARRDDEGDDAIVEAVQHARGAGAASAGVFRAWMAAFPHVGVQVAGDEECDLSEDHLAVLVDHPDAVVRALVASRSTCPAAVLRALSEDSAPAVREAVAVHPSTDEQTLVAMVLTPGLRVHEAICSRLGGAQWFVSHASDRVRRTGAHVVAWNDRDAYRALFDDPCPDVVAAAVAQGGAEEVEPLAGHGSAKVRAAVARLVCTHDLLTAMASDPSWSVRRAIAGNESAPLDVLYALAGDPVASVRAAAGLRVLRALSG